MSLLCRLFVLSVTVVAGSYADITRTVTSVVNPDCNNNPICTSNSNNFSLVYVSAPARNLNSSGDHWDEMNYIWSTIGHPAVIVSHTDQKQTVSVDWTNNSSAPIESIHLNGDFSMAIILSKIYTFKRDTLAFIKNTNGSITFDRRNSSIKFEIDPKKMQWDKFDNKSGTFHGTYPMPLNTTTGKRMNGTVSLDLKCFAASSEGEQQGFPHLPFSANTTLMEVQLNVNAPPTVQYDESIALELVVVPGPHMANRVNINRKRTLDDEYTPSTFYSYTMDVGGSHGGFVQWKPIVYTEEDKTVEDSELAYVEPVYDGKYTVIPWEKALPYSIVHPWYKGSSGLPIKNTSVFYVVYHPASGSTENPTFFSWTITLGYGKAPTQGFSTLVILTLTLGLGIPAGVTLLGSIYVIYKKWQLSKNSPGYIEIN